MDQDNDVAAKTDDEYTDDVASVTSAASTDCPTPTGTITSRPTTPTSTSRCWGHTSVIHDAAPWPGDTVIIVVKSPNGQAQALTLADGVLELRNDEPLEHQLGSWHWICVETGGWLGFRNAVSGKYLGRVKSHAIQAQVGHHQSWEYICPRRHPNGGYLLLMPDGNDRMLKIAVHQGKGTCQSILHVTYDGETTWEFIKV
ncbi:hypothetical protein B0T17DRAFT_541244 [Bombardia bombarda]|uniref:Uncharacterized protein n=1 Tax=Bombardia bombarda TaxID=252184 RepID=A0AA39WGW9_9PEZI|nr:hypothetical protein B0T17DRAFT_541244 [Bombardia bombarda]